MDVLTCPKCREETLERRERMVYRRAGAEAGTPPPLVPAICTRCHGLWLTRDDIARLQGGSASLKLEVPEAPPPDPEADRRGGLCPDCGRILVRAYLGEEPVEEGGADDGGFYLDRCAHCGGIWFDAGEWQALAADPSIDDLSRLWDPEWRRSRIEERNRLANRTRLEERLGPELLEAVEGLIARLRDEPEKRAAALAHLHEELGYEPS